jgi:transposase
VIATPSLTYENLSRDQLLETVKELTSQLLKFHQLQHELDQLKRLVFGSKHERFVASATPGQLALGLNVAPAGTPGATVQKVEYTRTVAAPADRAVPTGRMKLPAHLPRTRIEIMPEGDLTGCREIGEEITEELNYTPGNFTVTQYVRPKYAVPVHKDGATESAIVIAALPARPIDKCIAGASLLSHIVANKYIDHLPVYRQVQRFAREGMALPASTITGWISQVCALLEPLYASHCRLVFEGDYVQADETPLRVLDKDKKGSTHQGYLWAYRAPVRNLVVFDYRPGRGGDGPKKALQNFRGHLQSDGYEVYSYFDGKGITLLHCMAHGRRKFDEALGNDRQRAEHALAEIQKLYAIERRAKEENHTHGQRCVIRQEEALPILKALGQWMMDEYPSVLPQSAIGKAIHYCLQRWDKLSLYVTDGKLEIDNNLVENAIRPVAIGRKNYLFAGSHRAAQNTAMLYSFLGTCKINNINPQEWLEDVLDRIPQQKVNKLDELLPHKWKPRTSPTTQTS